MAGTVLAVRCSFTAPAGADLVGTFWGPASVQAQAQSEFVHLATGLNVIDADQSDILSLQPPVSPDFLPGGVYAVSAQSSARTIDLPSGSAAAKDLADGWSRVHYSVGAGVAADTYRFDVSGNVSNVDSWLTPGQRADLAVTQLTGVIGIEISQNSGDRTAFWSGDRVGALHLNPMRGPPTPASRSAWTWPLSGRAAPCCSPRQPATVPPASTCTSSNPANCA